MLCAEETQYHLRKPFSQTSDSNVQNWPTWFPHLNATGKQKAERFDTAVVNFVVEAEKNPTV
jgi:hypothetical protein